MSQSSADLFSQLQAVGANKGKDDDSTNDGLKIADGKRLVGALGKMTLGVDAGALFAHGGVQAGLERTDGWASQSVGALQAFNKLPSGIAKIVIEIATKNLLMGVGGGEVVYAHETGTLTPGPTPVSSGADYGSSLMHG